MTQSSYDSRFFNICHPLAIGTSPEEYLRTWRPAFLDGASGVFADSDVDWTLNDHLVGLAPGSPNGPAIPAGNGGNNQELRNQRAKRQKVHWAQIIKHVADPDLKIILRATPGDANAAWLAVEDFYTRPQNELRAIDQDLDWTQICMELIGYSEFSPRSLWSHILRVNNERPAADAYNEVKKRAKFLSCFKFPESLKTIAETELQHFSFNNSADMVSSFQERWSKRFRDGEIKARAGTLRQTLANPTNRVDANLNQASDLDTFHAFLSTASPTLAAQYSDFVQQSQSDSSDFSTFEAFRNSAIPGVNYDDYSFCWNCWGEGHRFKSVDGAILCPSIQKRRSLPALIASLQKVSKAKFSGDSSRQDFKGNVLHSHQEKPKFKFRFKKRVSAKAAEADEQLIDVDECGTCYDAKSGEVVGAFENGVMQQASETIDAKAATIVSSFAAGAVSEEKPSVVDTGSTRDTLKPPVADVPVAAPAAAFSATINDAPDFNLLSEDFQSSLSSSYSFITNDVDSDVESDLIQQRIEGNGGLNRGFKLKNVFAVLIAVIALVSSLSVSLLRSSTFLALVSLTSACHLGGNIFLDSQAHVSIHSSNFYRSSAFIGDIKKLPPSISKTDFGVIDSGTTKNSTGNKRIFPSKSVVKWNPAIRVEIANGVLLPVTALGVMLIPVKGWNGNPKTYKKFSLPLMDSILVTGLNCTLLSPKSMFRLQGIKTYLNDELYFMLPDGTRVDFDETERNFVVYFVDNPDFILDVKAFALNVTPVTADLIHGRMVHFSWDRIRASEEYSVGIPFDSLPDQMIRKPCHNCLKGMPPRKKNKHRPTTGKYTHFGHTVSSDICAMPKSTPFGFTAMLAFYDFHSRFIALYFIRDHNTEEVMSCYNLYHADHGKDMKNGHVETWLLDNDSVFTNKTLGALCTQMLTRLRFISAWNPWQNATETVWRIILRPLRITMAATNASEALWPFAANQIVRCHNGLASYSDFVPAPTLQSKFFSALYSSEHKHSRGVAQRKSPYFMKTGRKSDFTWTRVLFCHVDVRIRNQDDLRKITKVTPLSYPGVHLCQDDKRAGYFVYLFGPQRFTTAAWEDCIFDEETYPVINRILGHAVFDGKHTSLPSREQQEVGNDSVFQRPREDGAVVQPSQPGPDPVHGPSSDRAGDRNAVRGDFGPNHCRESQCTLPGGHAGFHSFELVRTPNDGRRLRDRNLIRHETRSAVTYARIVAAVEGYHDCDSTTSYFSSAHDARTYESYITAECDPSGYYCAHLTDEFPIYFNTQCDLVAGSQPGTLKQELLGCFKQEWIEACIRDIKAKMENKTFTLVEDEGQHSHKLGFALVHKWNDDLTLKERRARLVGRGYMQVETKDYALRGAYSATPTATSIRCFANFTLAIHGKTCLADVVKAFTLSKMDREFYVEQPYLHLPNMTVFGKNGKPKLALLHMALEGFKQSSNLFQVMHTSFLTNTEVAKRADFVFTQSTTEPCLFICHSSRGIIGAIVWIDDIWISYNGDGFFLDFKKVYKQRFPSTFEEPCQKYVGVNIQHSREDRMISLHQIPFIEKAYEKFMPKDRTPVDIPAFHDRKNPRHYSKFISPPTDSERKSMQKVPFLGLYATLLFGMTMTLPSISYNMSFTGQFMQDPSPDQYECLLDILSFCYVNRKQNVLRYQMLEPTVPKPFYRSGQVNDINALLKFFSNNMGLHGWCDGSWLLRSIIGYIVMCNGAALDWKTAILRVVCHSSAEAEISGGSLLMKKLAFIRSTFKDLSIIIVGAIPSLIDNTAAIELSSKDGASKKTNHFLRWQHTMRWSVIHLYSVLLFVFTHEQLANVLTKPVDLAELEWFSKIVYNHKAAKRTSDYLPKKSKCINPVGGTGSAMSHQ